MYSGHSRSVYRRGDESYKCTLCTSDTRWAHRTWRNQSERCSTLWDRSTRGESAVVNYITKADSEILLLQWLGYFYHMIWSTLMMNPTMLSFRTPFVSFRQTALQTYHWVTVTDGFNAIKVTEMIKCILLFPNYICTETRAVQQVC